MYILLTIFGVMLFVTACAKIIEYAGEKRRRRQEDQYTRLLAPLEQSLTSRGTADVDLIQSLASQPHLRRQVYATLAFCDQQSLFPADLLSARAQSEAALAEHVYRESQCQDVAQVIELETVVLRPERGPDLIDWHVFRYRLPESAARSDGWLLAVVTPPSPRQPYSGTQQVLKYGVPRGSIEPATLAAQAADEQGHFECVDCCEESDAA